MYWIIYIYNIRFVFLAFKIVLGGSYATLVRATHSASAIKKGLSTAGLFVIWQVLMWIDGYGWVDGWMDGRMDRCSWMDGWMDGWMDAVGWMDGWMDE
jgi:hypothetical protein